NGRQPWLNLAIALNAAGACTALAVVLAAVDVARTVIAGFFGRMLVQDYHVGARLAPSEISPSGPSS
ncbi:MAG: hypothetical protein ACRDNW_18530, partial [Trebonia sp.]